jgi:flagellin-like hook-associated protein FlgL
MSVINTNIQAIAAARNLNRSQEMLGRALNRLSSGSKIVNPSDDAAGLAVSEKLDAQNKRVKAATTNVQNAVSYVQTADGFMSGMTKILSRMSELAILAKDVTKNSTDVSLYGQEFRALQDQLRQTIGGTAAQIGGKGVDTPLGQFNGIKLFGDDNTTPLSIGATTTPTVYGPTLRAAAVTPGTFTPGTGMVIGSGASIAAGSTFGSNVNVGAGASIDGAAVGNNVTIGKNAYLGAGVVVEGNVSIGENAFVEAGVVLKAGTVIQPGAVVLKSNYPIVVGGEPDGSDTPEGTVPAGSVVSKQTLLDSVTAGAYSAGGNLAMGAGAVVGLGASLGDNVSLGEKARVAKNAVIADGVTIGAGAYVAEGVTIGANVKVPPGAVVLEDIPADYEFPAVTSGGTTPSSGLTVTVGQAVGQTMTIPPINLRTGAMQYIINQNANGDYTLDVTDPDSIGAITDAIQHVANERASLGASQSRLELASTTLQVEFENLESAISRIRDVDVADESTQYARFNILVQSGTAMLAQANQTPQSVLKLLQG